MTLRVISADEICMTPWPLLRRSFLLGVFLGVFAPARAFAAQLTLPSEVPAVLDKIYSFDIDRAAQDAKQVESSRPQDP